MGRPTRGAEQRKNETKPPHAQSPKPRRRNTTNTKQTPTARKNETTAHAARTPNQHQPAIRTNETTATTNPKRALKLRTDETAAKLHYEIPAPDEPLYKMGGLPVRGTEWNNNTYCGPEMVEI